MKQSERIKLAYKSVKGISIGDAFGESFFGDPEMVLKHIDNRTIPETTFEFTDDTVMAIAVLEQLENKGAINQDDLALLFSKNHDLDPNRGYGATARRILREIGEGSYWKNISQNVFEGMGSMGNGASMRVGAIGAYHFDNLVLVKNLAKDSAEITHSNIEGITGAIAVALSTAIATKIRIEKIKVEPSEFIQMVVKELPESDTKSKINKSLSVPYNYRIETVHSILGNGSQILSQDTVPFSIWCAAHNLKNFEESIWKAVSILGDRDTICAIVGGITIMSSEDKTIPKDWFNNVEDFETSIFKTNNNVRKL